MTQEQFNQRLTAAIVRLGEIMKRAGGDASAGVVLQDLARATACTEMRLKRVNIANAEEQLDMLAEALPPEARCADAALLENVKAAVLACAELNAISGQHPAQVGPPKPPKI